MLVAEGSVGVRRAGDDGVARCKYTGTRGNNGLKRVLVNAAIRRREEEAIGKVECVEFLQEFAMRLHEMGQDGGLAFEPWWDLTKCYYHDHEEGKCGWNLD